MRIKGDGSIMNKAYERETEMWNQVFKECTPVDLRTLDLQVETMLPSDIKMPKITIMFIKAISQQLNDICPNPCYNNI